MNKRNTSPRVLLEGLAGTQWIEIMVLLSPLLRGWYSKWGATDEEATRPLPGDEIIPEPKSKITLAVTVHAPAAAIWPWFVQLGCQKAGWYSYDLLDNNGVPSADRIIPEYQHIEVGDDVWAVPNGALKFPVAAIDPNRSLVLGGMLNTATGKSVGPGEPKPDQYFGGSMIVFLDERPDGTTRLIFRNLMDWSPGAFQTFGYKGCIEPISFVMGRKMLLSV